MGYGLSQNPSVPPPFLGFTSLFFGYLVAGVPSGWRTLTKITPRVFLILPLAGWVLYFVYKLAASAVIGPFVLPFRLASSICLLTGAGASRAKLYGVLGLLGLVVVALVGGHMTSNKAPGLPRVANSPLGESATNAQHGPGGREGSNGAKPGESG
jgi:hypothetical protein